MSYTEHPVSHLLDAAAARGRPPESEIEEVSADVVRADLGPSPLTAPGVAGRVRDAVGRIERERADGNAGRARAIARTVSQELADALPPYKPPSDQRSVREIIADIPRGF